MKLTSTRLRRLRWAALACLGAACGSVSMGGGIAGTSSVLGSISGFGSIVVAGIEFDTTGAAITIEGDPATEADLRLGMVAAVRGVVDGRGRGTAQAVNVEDIVEGPIERLDAATATLVVLAQDVVIAGAVLDPLPLADLEPGDDVEVSGFRDASGRIRATRVARKLEDVEIEIKGVVTDLDRATSRFAIGALIVDFAGALIEGAPPGGLENGLLVEVEAEEPPTDDLLVAIGVEIVDPSLAGDAGDGLKVEGFVTAIVSSTELIVNDGQRVTITSETRFVNGGPADLVLDAGVEVEGVAAPDGSLRATEIEFGS
jgi:hypothetical protein